MIIHREGIACGFLAMIHAALAVSAEARPADQPAPSAASASSPRDARFDPHPLAFGIVHEERITPEDLTGPDDKDRHRWRFEGKAGQGVRIDIRSGEFPAMGFLRREGKTLASSEPAPAIAANPDAPGDAFIEYFLPETGSYEVIVRSNAQKGRYSIQAVVGRETPPVWALLPAMPRESWGKTSSPSTGVGSQRVYVSGDGGFSFIVPSELQPVPDALGKVRFATEDSAFRCVLELDRQSSQSMSNGQLALRQKLQIRGRVLAGSDIPVIRKNVFNYGITPLAAGAAGEPPQAGFLFAAYTERDPQAVFGQEPDRSMVDGELIIPINGGDFRVTCSALQASAAWIETALSGLRIHTPAGDVA
jgi:hypothetical protein